MYDCVMSLFKNTLNRSRTTNSIEEKKIILIVDMSIDIVV